MVDLSDSHDNEFVFYKIQLIGFGRHSTIKKTTKTVQYFMKHFEFRTWAHDLLRILDL